MHKKIYIFDAKVDCLNWDETITKILKWALKKESKYVCLMNTHSLITSGKNDLLLRALNNSDLTLPDGFPIAKLINTHFVKKQPRIAGPDLMLNICKSIEKKNISIFLLGSTRSNLKYLKKELMKSFPDIKISGSLSPKIGNNIKKNNQLCKKINGSKAQITFIGLGCPKQEIWMSQHSHKIQSILIGVGAAFDINAKIIKRSPIILQNLGLEWLHRLTQEPFRLSGRYFKTNSIFIFRLLSLILSRKKIVVEKN